MTRGVWTNGHTLHSVVSCAVKALNPEHYSYVTMLLPLLQAVCVLWYNRPFVCAACGLEVLFLVRVSYEVGLSKLSLPHACIIPVC